MRKLLAFLAAGIAVGVALGRILGRRRRTAAPAPAVDAADPRAEALRVRLAASRDAEPAAATPAVEPEGVEAEVDEARRRVHEKGRAAVERMRGAEGDS